MTHFGKIKSWNNASGTGTITPEKGGEALSFKKADLQQQGQEPKPDQRFGYETQAGDGGKNHAVKMQLQPA